MATTLKYVEKWAIWYIHKLWSKGLAWTMTKGKPSPETS